ncbi:MULTISPECIES: hypothetical protein [Streptomyces]|uniref:hypothetical protein n=1 Tax=Streptomyces TaxID=1883 RepID=UPI0033BD2CFB
MYASLIDRVCWVSGGADDIGRAIAVAPAGSGVRVMVADLDEVGGRQVADAAYADAADRGQAARPARR